MSEMNQPQNEQSPAPSERALLLRRILPHILTGALAIALSIGIQSALPGASGTPAPAPTVAIATVTPEPTTQISPTVPAQPTAPLPASDITRQELLDLRAEDDRIWSAIYLSRAISQVADAESALRTNDFDRADQMIVATDDSLALAYGHTSGGLRDPIAQLRRDASLIREDLYLRPEGIDLRLMRFRQTLLALIAERR